MTHEHHFFTVAAENLFYLQEANEESFRFMCPLYVVYFSFHLFDFSCPKILVLYRQETRNYQSMRIA